QRRDHGGAECASAAGDNDVTVAEIHLLTLSRPYSLPILGAGQEGARGVSGVHQVNRNAYQDGGDGADGFAKLGQGENQWLTSTWL
ncbi:MAG: hypothetical protein WBE82_07130, partial [Xanthobacteraceae bacterium]